MSNRFGRLSKGIVTQPFALYAVGFAIGAVAWSGHLWTLPLSLLMIALLPPSRTIKNRWLVAAGYFSGATWTVVPGAAIFYGHDYNPFAIIPLWLGVSFLLAGPWAILCTGDPKRLLWAVPASLILESIPPLAPLGLANPLIAAGALFPYTQWFGLLFLAILATAIAIAPRPTIVMMVSLTLVGLAAPIQLPPQIGRQSIPTLPEKGSTPRTLSVFTQPHKPSSGPPSIVTPRSSSSPKASFTDGISRPTSFGDAQSTGFNKTEKP
jgi:hypothetical protein